MRHISRFYLGIRTRVVLGFIIVLLISAADSKISVLGFRQISETVAEYRNSVTNSDLARNIDRDLISFQSAVRYFIVTGDDVEAKAAQLAQASLRSAIDQSGRP